MSNSFATPWTVACQAPLSMGLPRQEHWSGLPFPSPGDLRGSGIEPESPEKASKFFTTEPGHNWTSSYFDFVALRGFLFFPSLLLFIIYLF